MYTYKEMYEVMLESENHNDSKLQWLFIDESKISKGKELENWSNNRNILCKIGMTTNKVPIRLNAWERSCKHEVINLTPENIQTLLAKQTKLMLQAKPKPTVKNSTWPISMKQMISLFTKMKLKDSKPQQQMRIQSPSPPIPPNLITYKDGGFFHDSKKGTKTLREVEANIHNILWAKYGKALTNCFGCDPNGNKHHTEWFCVPISELPNVLKTIDSICHRS
ncbi:hypothetical protein Kpol_1032p66 [Vanderwaltozyma polyspora DSM 70294]|uniref:Uncharacterized protein n=1 Tax=Vanderwaltozyma polyspora (strain ATCC 22028 / DSM 70294 / BCRC 21397 / CBS 2163 / NBRC 10782 / NRRL Y-8283 / UCD 57-17) TaxID=436907 RepID=A7TH20_VANPO|nr:uncharacterized protein Kpol_1032p66 [Vanderwaltozyma polyspora DSM 70294]EDO18472.1 hypothetical protein Kpol_1032p66 [Vanderwaltozyma polyspora DSM 70294]